MSPDWGNTFRFLAENTTTGRIILFMTEGNSKFTKRDLVKTVAGVVATGTLAACSTGVDTGPILVDPIQAGNPDNNPQTTLTVEAIRVTEGEFTFIADEKRVQDLYNSLPVNKPASMEGEKPEAFSIKAGDKEFDFVLYKMSREEALNSKSIVVTFGGITLELPQTTVLYAQYKGIAGTSWERLVGVPIPDAEGNFSQVAWYYDPEVWKGSNPNLQNTVLAINVPESRIQFMPLVETVESIPGWDGKGPLDVKVAINLPDGLKVQANVAPQATETAPAQPEEVIVFSPDSKIQTHNVEYKGSMWDMRLVTDPSAQSLGISEVKIDSWSLAAVLGNEYHGAYSIPGKAIVKPAVDKNTFLKMVAEGNPNAAFKIKVKNSRDGSGEETICLNCKQEDLKNGEVAIRGTDIVVVHSSHPEVKKLYDSGLGFGIKIDYQNNRLVVYYSPYDTFLQTPQPDLNFGQGFGTLSAALAGRTGAIDNETTEIIKNSGVQFIPASQ